jgi:Cd2+/Zn2+-exporting ATPase
MAGHSMTKKQKKSLRNILIAAALYAVLIILGHAGVLPGLFKNRRITLILYLIPYLIVGFPVLKKAVIGIGNRQMLDESFLMTLASIGAFVTGQTSEAVAVMLFYQVGEFFQDYAVNRSRASIRDLLDIAPEYANVERADGTVEEIDPEEVAVGDILVIMPGEKIPVDGTVVQGDSMVNTAALTGESVPRSVRTGSQLFSGCINGDGLLKMRAEKQYDDSTVARILELVENASEKKSHTENFITRFSHYYTPLVVLGAVILAVIPSIITKDPMTWIYRACTFLVISCPCALVLSVPLAFFGGIGSASKAGILVKGSNYLELMAGLDTVVSDKTGTLTQGNFHVSRVQCAEGISKKELLETASLAEGLSTHPIAVSIREALEEEGIPAEQNLSLVSDVENVTGRGLVATVRGKKVYVGNEKMMEENGIAFTKADDDAATIVYVAGSDRYMGAILIRDEVKPEAREAIAAMKELGVRNVIMLTGDRKEVGDAVGRELGIDRVYSELLPQDKVSRVEQLLAENKSTGRRLAFIGDGINDAPVLTRADVGIAMGSMGSDAAIEAADIVIMDDNLNKIPAAMKVAGKTVGISRENIIFALAVKTIILVLGALGLAGMWAAVFADVGVAVLCILNSMRLLIYSPRIPPVRNTARQPSAKALA